MFFLDDFLQAAFEIGFDDALASLRRFFAMALDGFAPGTFPPRNEPLFNERYLAEELTRRQCAFFSLALAPQAPKP